MGGYPVSPEIEALIKVTWLDMKKKGYEPVAKEVLESVRHYLYLQGKGNVPLPKLRKFQLILSEVREKYSERTEQDKIQDKPWTMAMLNEYQLPAHAIPHIGKVWRYAAATDEPFTIRQAKWVARIYPLFDNVTMLWFMSRRYARQEEITLISGEPMDTYRVDTNVFLSRWEQATLESTDFRSEPIKYFQAYDDRFLPKENESIVLEILHGLKDYQYNRLNDKPHERDSKLSHLIRKLPTIDSTGLTYEAQLVYLRWFTYLLKGPKWKELSPKEALDIIVKLRELILHEQKYRSSDDFMKGGGFIKGFAEMFNLSSQPFGSAMRNLLFKVGYEYAKKEEYKSTPEEIKAKQNLINKFQEGQK